MKTPLLQRILLVAFFSCGLHHATDAAFSFTLDIQSHSTSGTCDTFLAPECETFFSIFCLRGPRSSASNSTSDCPLGTSGRFDNSSGSRTISSDSPWPVRNGYSYYLFIKINNHNFHREVFSSSYKHLMMMAASLLLIYWIIYL